MLLELLREQLKALSFNELVKVIKFIVNNLEDSYPELGSKVDALAKKLREAIEEWERE